MALCNTNNMMMSGSIKWTSIYLYEVASCEETVNFHNSIAASEVLFTILGNPLFGLSLFW